jgi:hypothetical protein
MFRQDFKIGGGSSSVVSLSFILPPAARGLFYKTAPWTPAKFFIKLR